MAAAGGEFNTKIRLVSGVRLLGSSSSYCCFLKSFNKVDLEEFYDPTYFIAMTPSSLEFCSQVEVRVRSFVIFIAGEFNWCCK